MYVVRGEGSSRGRILKVQEKHSVTEGECWRKEKLRVKKPG